MTAGPPTGSGDHGEAQSPDTRARDLLVHQWATALRTTAYVPLSPAEIQQLLRELADLLVAALRRPAVDTKAAADVGARLVAADFTGEQSLPRTIEVFATALPATTGTAAIDRSGSRLIELLGAVVTGYTGALRDRIFEQQEDVVRALLSAHRDVERELQACAARFHELFDSAPMGIILSAPEGRILRTNRAFDERLGYAPDELVGSQLSGLFAPDEPDELTAAQQRYERLRHSQDSRFRMRLHLRRRDGGPESTHLSVSVLRDAQQRPQYLATMINDLAELNLLKELLKHQTLHDLQTGLPNRQYFVSHLEQVFGRLDPAAMITLLHLDLDGFAAINDGLGHESGDRVLDVVARRLRKVVADQRAMVARIGGDEFAILVEPGESMLDVGALAERINTELATPLPLGTTGVALTATIGVVQRRVAEADHTELLRAAGSTLRRLRGKGKRQWAPFDADADAIDRAELRLAAALPGALHSGELVVRYQPVVTLDCGRLVGVEAGLGWRHPELGMLSHERTAQLAEQTGVVYAVEQWLLRSAAEQAAAWHQHIDGPLPPVVVNLTGLQAQNPDLIAQVRAVLAETGLGPAGLELRAPVAAIRTTSGAQAGQGGEHAEDNLRVLAELGVRTGLHDFGGGIGALRCLADLSIGAVRVAQLVSQQVADDPSRILSQSVHALIHIVRGAGIDVIAYPVESSEQADCWRWVGANWAMGTLYGPPGPPGHLELLLEARADIDTS